MRKVNLIDLLEIASLKSGNKSELELIKDIDVDARVDKEVLAQEIVVKCGAMCPVYNTSWSFLYWHKHWFELHKREISELCNTLEYEYIPIESYSRYDDLKHNATSNTGLNETSGRTRKEGRGLEVNGTENSTTENQTSAYNESLYQPESKSIFGDTNGRSEQEKKDTEEDETREYTRDNVFDSKDNNYVHGNNGLFTVQHLIEEQRKLVQFNVIQWIVGKYMQEGFLLVY